MKRQKKMRKGRERNQKGTKRKKERFANCFTTMRWWWEGGCGESQYFKTLVTQVKKEKIKHRKRKEKGKKRTNGRESRKSRKRQKNKENGSVITAS